MTFATVHSTLESRFRSQIELGGDGGSAIPTIYPESALDEPTSGAWARLSIRYGERDRADIGDPVVRSRETGVLFVEFVIPAKGGTAALYALADRVRAAFERRTLAGVVVGTVSRTISGIQRAGEWARLVVSVPWYFDDAS